MHITKKADLIGTFIEGFINQIKDDVDFKEKPFETLFGVFGTALSWRFGWIVGGLVTAAQMFGFGPGEIGKLIDDYFKGQGSKVVSDMNFSQSNVQGAAESAVGVLTRVVDGAFESTKAIFAQNVQDIKNAKGYITSNDKRTAFFVATTTSYNLNKTARRSHLARFFKLWKRGNRMQIVANVLMKLIWTFVKGLLALGIGGGIASTFGVRPKRDIPPKGEGVFRTEPGVHGPGKVPSTLKYYSNISGDVKHTLIRFLDSTIANFSTGFVQAQKLADPSKLPIPLERAPGWTKVLSDVERYNWGSVHQINELSAFVAPRLKNIAQTLLNSVNVSGVKIEKIQEQPKPKPIELSPASNSGEKLEKLLQGDMRI